MTRQGTIERFDDVAKLAVRAIQAVLGGLIVYGAVVGELGLATNAAMSLVVAFLPSILRRRYGFVMSGPLALWIAAAALLHAIGALGPYETVPWYDQVTHTLSATLVAGAGYAIVRAIDLEHDEVTIPPRLRSVFILIFVVAFGVLWEIAEFATSGIAALVGGEPALTQYGVEDTVMDLVFDAVGAVLIALLGTGYFDRLSRLFAHRIDRAEQE